MKLPVPQTILESFTERDETEKGRINPRTSSPHAGDRAFPPATM
jgi:hypothetical protein